MDDRVGDLLAQRASLDAGRAPAILISLLMHGGISALAVWSAMHAPAPQAVSVLNIKFAGAPMTPMTPAAPVTKPKPATPRIEAPKPKAEEVKPSPAKPEPKAVPFSPFGKSEKKGTEHPVTAPPVPAPAAPAAPQIPLGGTGVTGLEGGDFPYTIYIDRMKTLIGQHWLRPQANDVTTTVYFIIDRDGTVRDAKVETASNNSTFDRAALRAVLESTPLPPLPFGYGGNFLGVHLTFR